MPIGLAIALLTNLGRTLALSLAGARGGETALNAMHDPAGWGALALLIGGIFVVGGMLRGPWAGNGTDTAVSEEQMRPNYGNTGWIAVSGMVVLGVVAGQGWYLLHEISSRDVRGGQLVVRESADVDAVALPDYVTEQIHPTSGHYVRLGRPGDVSVTGYHLVWDDTRNNAEALFHRPDVCMPGAGWKSSGQAELASGQIDGEPVTWAVLRYEKGGVHALMLWAAWLDGEPLQFSLHSGSSVQQNTLMRLIGNGRRKFSYEVAAVMMPYDGENPPVKEAVAAAAEVFGTRSENAP